MLMKQGVARVPIQQYTFVRADTTIGDLSEVPGKSDAMQAVESWQQRGTQRRLTVNHESPEKLTVTLQWDDSDREADEDLHALCIKHGVKQEAV